MAALPPDNGLPALFALSFLAATVIPLGSEWLRLPFFARTMGLAGAYGYCHFIAFREMLWAGLGGAVANSFTMPIQNSEAYFIR